MAPWFFWTLTKKALFNWLQTTNLHERPLLHGLDADGLKNFIHEKLEERMPVYRQADVVFNPVTSDIKSLLSVLNETTG